MSAKIAMQPVQESGWRRGFANVLRKENRDWWGTRRWWVHLIIWTLLLNSTVFIPLFLQSSEPPAQFELTEVEREQWIAGNSLENRAAGATRTFVDFAGMALMVGAIIIMQNVLIDEKRTGTAAWILSKPVSRTGFLVAKLVANGMALIGIVVVVQWALCYVQLWAATGIAAPVGNYLLAMGIVSLNMCFYLTLVLMLGALFNNRGALVTIPIMGLFITMYLSGNIPALINVTPLSLIFGTLGNPQEGIVSSLAMQAVMGEPITAFMPIITTVLWSILFFVVAVWRFRREEF